MNEEKFMQAMAEAMKRTEDRFVERGLLSVTLKTPEPESAPLLSTRKASCFPIL